MLRSLLAKDVVLFNMLTGLLNLCSYFSLVCLFLPGYVQTKILLLVSRSSAEEALVILQSTLIGGQNVRLSWGRSPSNKQAQVGSCILTCLFHTLSIKTDVFIFAASTGFQPVGWG